MRTRSPWVDVVVIGSILAVGIVIAGVTDDPAEPTAAIPGCDSVESPEELQRIDYAFVIPGVEPADTSWLTPEKASSMSVAVADALPEDVERTFAGPLMSLTFQPIGDMPAGALADSYAMGSVVRDGAEGSVNLSVGDFPAGIPACVSGQLDTRTTFADGTVVDTLVTASEQAGLRRLANSVTAYTPDGTRIQANAVDVPLSLSGDRGESGSGVPPLSLTQLTDIVTLPQLRTSTTPPAGTLPLPTNCDALGYPGGQPLTRAELDAANTALDTYWASAPRDVALDRPLGSMQVSDYAHSSACGKSGPLTVAVVSIDPSTPESGTAASDDGSGVTVSTVGEMADDGTVTQTTVVTAAGASGRTGIASGPATVDAPTLESIARIAAGAAG